MAGNIFDVDFKWLFFIFIIVILFLLFGISNIKWFLIIGGIVFLIKMLKG